MKHVVFTLFAVLLFVGTYASSQDGYLCYHTQPVQTPHGTDCKCVLNFNEGGWCSCTSGHACAHQYYCPEECGITAISPWQQSKIAQMISEQTGPIFTIFMKQKCAEGTVGNAFVQEAMKQGKAIRIVTPPANLKTRAEVDKYNQFLGVLQDRIAAENKAIEDADRKLAP